MSPAHDGREHVEARVHARRGPPTHGRSVPPTQVGPTALRPGFWAPVLPVQMLEVVHESDPRRRAGSIPGHPSPHVDEGRRSPSGFATHPGHLVSTCSREADRPDAVSACRSRCRGRSRTARTRRADAPASHTVTHTRARTHIRTHARTHARTHTHARARTRAYTYTRTHTHTHTHIHTCT